MVPAPRAVSPDVLDFGEMKAEMKAEKKRGLGGRLAVVGVALAVVAGAGYAVTTAMTEPAGPQSPDEVAEGLVAALENDDMLAMIELMAPAEREAYLEPGMDLLTEIARLEEQSFDPNGPIDLPGEFTVTDVTYEIESLGGGIYWLTTTGGEITGVITPDDIPGWMKAMSDEPIEADEETVDLAEDPLEFAIIAEDDGFYWSMVYSVAELIRSETELAAPDFGNGLVPVGAASPTETVDVAIRSLLDFDLDGVATQLDPREFRAFYDYAPLFMDDANEMVEGISVEAQEQGFEVEMNDLVLSQGESNGRTIVYLDRMVLTYQTSGDAGPVVATYEDGCLVTEAPGQETTDSCDVEMGDEWACFVGPNAEVKTGITVVERDGRWYLSGVPTVIGSYTDVLRAIDVDGWKQLKSDLRGIFGLGADGLYSGLLGSTETAHTDFEPVGPAITEGIDETPVDPAVEEDPIDPGPPDLPADFAEIDSASVAHGYMPFPEDPASSYANFALDIGTPVTLTLFSGVGSAELWEYESPDVTDGFENYLVSEWDCEVKAEHGYGEGATVAVCFGETYVRYDRWIMQTWGEGDDAVASILPELDHLRSFD